MEGNQLTSMGDLVGAGTGAFRVFGWLAGTKMLFLRVSSKKGELTSMAMS